MSNEKNAYNSFHEVQRFHQFWIWIILVGMNGLFLFGLYKQTVLHQQFGDKPMDNAGLIISETIIIFITLLFRIIKLETEIGAEGIKVKFFPIHLQFRTYRWEDISEVTVRKYNPIMEYGGWGIRFGLFGSGKAYNISGNNGIQLIFMNGKKLLIGTKIPEDARQALMKYWKG